MSSHITASVEFYFRGEKLSAAIDLDLDKHMQATGKIPDLSPMLASAIDLDLYSYEYEVMQTETIVFSQASGLAAEYLAEGRLDIDAFEDAWKENRLMETLREIAQRNLLSDDLLQQPEFKNALLEAYRLGEKEALQQST